MLKHTIFNIFHDEKIRHVNVHVINVLGLLSFVLWLFRESHSGKTLHCLNVINELQKSEFFVGFVFFFFLCQRETKSGIRTIESERMMTKCEDVA